MLALFLGLVTILYWFNAIACLALSMGTPHDDDRIKYAFTGLLSVLVSMWLVMQGTLS